MSTVHSLCPCMYMRLLNDQNAFRLKFFHISILIRQKKRTKKTHTLQSNYACESCASCCAIQQTITLFLIAFRFLCSLFLRQTIFQVYKSIRVKVICVISSIFSLLCTLWSMPWMKFWNNAIICTPKERKKERKASVFFQVTTFLEFDTIHSSVEFSLFPFLCFFHWISLHRFVFVLFCFRS